MIFVKLCGQNKWSGATVYPNCAKSIGPYIMKNRQLYTGFEGEDLKLRTEIENAISTDLSPTSLFWDTYDVKLDAEGKWFDIEGSIKDRLDYIFLKNHKDRKRVGDNSSSYPVFEIVDEEESAKVVNQKGKEKRKALQIYDKMTPEEMRGALVLYGNNPSDTSNEVVQARLFEMIDKDPVKFRKIWVDNKHRDTQVLINKALNKGVITRRGKRFLYNTEELGFSIEDATAFLEKQENTQMKLGIQKQVEG